MKNTLVLIILSLILACMFTYGYFLGGTNTAYLSLTVSMWAVFVLSFILGIIEPVSVKRKGGKTG